MKMKLFTLFLAGLVASALSLQVGKTGGTRFNPLTPPSTRAKFMQQTALVVTGVAVIAPVEPAFARGRATLDQAYDRYTPRILAGGEFYKKDLRVLIQNSDWNGIKTALAEPPKKAKEDRSKQDGGASERAAKAGGFSDSRVLVACDLYAATFSESSVSAKTKAMKTEVEKLRAIVQDMEITARQALGEDTGGGFFGIGAKKPSKDELSRKMKELYIQGGTVWNQFIFAANDGLPVQLQKLPFL